MSTDTPRTPATSKGAARRRSIIDAAAEIIRESGPSAVTHRGVAERAGCSLSATTYYFSGLDDLLYEAGRVNIALWAERAERVARRVEALDHSPSLEEAVQLLLSATLPDAGPYLGHYMQLISANTSVPVGRAYGEGRNRLNAAVDRVVNGLGLYLTAETVIATVDGAAVTALSEHRDVRSTALALLRRLVQLSELSSTVLADATPEEFRTRMNREMPLPTRRPTDIGRDDCRSRRQ
ncbi:DNA-binding transcriptional regulator YbjK [Actinomyces ruminicola]|uniref:DNA-binding transcriptional regulator YbjK n=1 Tax=Actinomyces ruminicola TaxID=332524 RepID=A0A1H0B4R4_9ACTO|nr:TetR family transcriptional regulator [Actinomyces ruminicola]SDN40655.1 DNA-binding transcriptional regulator YbjK [Actinomyces ruminicola]